jgi:hypothetical protein
MEAKMNIFESLKFVLDTPELPAGNSDLPDATIRKIVAAHSHGNIRLQSGEFYTEADVEAQYERYKNRRFSSAS